MAGQAAEMHETLASSRGTGSFDRRCPRELARQELASSRGTGRLTVGGPPGAGNASRRPAQRKPSVLRGAGRRDAARNGPAPGGRDWRTVVGPPGAGESCFEWARPRRPCDEPDGPPGARAR
ncbi:hypothetical protein N7535_002774 [Penicillium sp. DV-2018c]|nr:hypothetical protein N7535_002774 [Penicillium sp. DV-2018c]